MEIGFLKKGDYTLNNIMKYSYLLFFIAVTIYLAILGTSFFIAIGKDLFVGFSIFVLFVLVLLFIYFYHRALLKIFCKIQENVSLEDYIGSLTNPLFGRIFKYSLLAGSALLASYFLQCFVLDNFYNMSPLIFVLAITIFSIGLANLESKQKDYSYEAAKKEFNLQTKISILLGAALFCLILSYPLVFSNFFLIVALGFVALVFLALVFLVVLSMVWKMLLVRGAIETTRYIMLKYIFVVLILFASMLFFPALPWGLILLILSLVVIVIFTIAYGREYFQEISRRYRRY